MFLPAEIIKKKRNGLSLTSEEIQYFIKDYTEGRIPDYQMSALAMAIYFKGMNSEETLALTKAMLFSGVVVDFNHIPVAKVDKHSTGGVGDKTSLILGPIVASCGLVVPMISGRGLGHTGGTLDKLESIPGFNTQISIENFKKYIEKYHICFIGQTKEICPADKKVYALRDVTATIESMPLICASIMSKKLAEGIDALVLDVKYGSGAFMKTFSEAKELAIKLMDIAKGYGKKISTVLSTMNQPLGRYAGNSLEVFECLEIMRGKSYIVDGIDFYEDTRELSLILSAQMLWLGGRYTNFDEAYAEAKKSLYDGRALKKFIEMCEFQGGDISKLPQPKNSIQILLPQSGYIKSMDTEKIGVCLLKIKAGRAIASDTIEPTAGIEFHKKIGHSVKKGDVLFTLFGENASLLSQIEHELLSSILFSETITPIEPLYREILT